MIRNYFKIAWRHLWKFKAYAALNIGGLAIGMSAGFLLLLYIIFEFSYDNFHSKSDRLYRVVTDITTPSGEHENTSVDWNILSELQSELPQIEDYTRVQNTDLDVRVNSETYQENEVIAADASLFNLFDFKLVQGDPATALTAPLSIILSENTAKKYFGAKNPLGRVLKIMDGKYNAKVTGVVKDFPENTLIKGDMILSLSTYTEVIDPSLKDSWAEFSNYGYVLLNQDASPEILEEKIKKYNEEAHGDIMNKTQLKLVYRLEPLKDVYLFSNQGNVNGKISNVYTFGIVAVFIILIAAINFINLTTARSTERAKEVGIRKVIGAQKRQLTFQFLSESMIICFFAFIFSIGLTALVLPYFNELAGKVVASTIFDQPSNLLILFGIAMGIALIAGSYPAWVLSSFKTTYVLKGKFSRSSKGTWLRKGLVISQFTISVLLIIGTIIIYKQTNFMRAKDLGFNKEQLLVLETGVGTGQDRLKSALAENPNILSMSTSSGVPGGGGKKEAILSTVENKKGHNQSLALIRNHVDVHYIPQLDLKLVAGRNFSNELASDSTTALIINEKTTQMLGYANPKNAIGKKFDQGDRKGQIIGVVRDFHFTSLQKEIRALSIVMGGNQNQLLNLKVNTENLQETISTIETYWERYIPKKTFDYYFLDEFFDRQYRSEEQFGTLFLIFTILALFIASLGLLGLASYSIMQRRREIGIRKIMGASVLSILNLVSADFLKLILISISIASPIAWYFTYNWLQDFAYRISIEWWVFVTAGLVTLFISLLIVSFQVIKAAIANPIKSLRTE
ncbi:ABC transporter permease [Salegentibacter sp. LM13S]|uniref:ABC transporter permease n=1 Tax=Salegentibacter lacus TaxID=2873599 RepID=UPI001CC9A908|nr:ABC transporter permease [Salegentibacter lacus]MBZ9629720.1 ABC transporter permease [Salegentibacter lacus]